MKKLIKYILDLLFPKHCLGCKKEGTLCCHICLTSIHPLKTQPGLEHAKYLNKLYVASCYNKSPVLKKLIHHLKYRGEQDDTPKILGNILTQTLKNHNITANTLIPVPLHPKRQRYRGFNQAEILAKQLSQQINTPISTSSLKRTRHTKSQVKAVSREKRILNLNDAFRATNPPPHCLIIDDVCTTGATLEECAKALKKAGARQVDALVLARNF